MAWCYVAPTCALLRGAKKQEDVGDVGNFAGGGEGSTAGRRMTSRTELPRLPCGMSTRYDEKMGVILMQGLFWWGAMMSCGDSARSQGSEAGMEARREMQGC